MWTVPAHAMLSLNLTSQLAPAITVARAAVVIVADARVAALTRAVIAVRVVS